MWEMLVWKGIEIIMRVQRKEPEICVEKVGGDLYYEWITRWDRREGFNRVLKNEQIGFWVELGRRHI